LRASVLFYPEFMRSGITKDMDGSALPVHPAIVNAAAMYGFLKVLQNQAERGQVPNWDTFHLAAAFGRRDIVDYLLTNTAQFNVLNGNSFWTAYASARNGHVEVVASLLRHPHFSDLGQEIILTAISNDQPAVAALMFKDFAHLIPNVNVLSLLEMC